MLITCPESVHENGLMEWNTQPLDCKSDLISPPTDYVPDTVRPIYFLSDREDSQAEFSLPPKMAETSVVNAFV